MKILLTGGSGFIGKHIVDFLLEKDAEIICPLIETDPNLELFSEKPLTVRSGDLTDAAFTDGLFEEYKPDTVIHLAWKGVTGPGRNEFSQLDNLLMFQNFMESIKKNPVKTFIGFGSQAEYGVYNHRIDENVLPKPNSLYGIYKLSAALMGLQFAKTLGFNYAWLRLFSTYGPGDDPYYIIPYSITKLIKGEAPELTPCEQKWDYLYVKDIPKIVWRILSAEGEFQDIYNLCSGNPRMLKDIILTVTEVLDTNIKPAFGALEYRKGGISHLEGDNSKLNGRFGVIEETPFKTTIAETIEYFKKYGK